MDLFHALDYGTYSFFHFAAQSAPAVYTDLMRGGDLLGGYFGVGIILALTVAFAPSPKRLRVAVVVIAAFFLGAMLVEGLKWASYRSRPETATEMTSSFPSRAVFLSAFAWSMLAASLEWRMSRRWARAVVYVPAVLGIVFICVSQLWLGLGWVTDVLAGLAGGIGLVLVARWVLALDPRGPSPHPAASV
jgi:undecaprenyl-diphosphatase